MLSISSPITVLCRPATAVPRRTIPSRPSFVASASATATFTSFQKSSRPRATSPRQARDMAAACNSFYEILGISVGASGDEIKTAYRRLARVCHPDVAAAGRKDAANEFMRIHAAYSTLSDPQKRAVYDGKLYRKSRPATVMSSGVSGYRGRNWETDQCW